MQMHGKPPTKSLPNTEYFNNDYQIKNALLDAIELKWREYRDDDEEFEAVKVTHLSMKAGLPPDAWREGASFTVFEAIVFHE